MSRRIFGIETEFGLTCVAPPEHAMTPDAVAREMFRKVVAWGRSSNVFLENGSRLYLDVGSHPEYATAECDDVAQLIAYDRAGERIVEDLASYAQEQLESRGHPGRVHLFKNNTDSAGNSYGCHENYLVRRQGDFTRLADILVPFLITRQIMVGAGKILVARPGQATYCFSQRADHMWEAVSSATTRSRPIINTRDEPHADAELYRRLHVIVGDSSMAEPSMLLKMGSTDLVLRLVEAAVPMPSFALENPMQAIRDVSHDLSGRAPITLRDGRTMTAIELQREYLRRVSAVLDQGGEPRAHDEATLDLWERALDALESGDLSAVDTELDWAIKLKLVRRYQDRLDVPLDDPRILRLDLAYHDVSRQSGLYHRLVDRGLVRTMVSEEEVEQAAELPPATTRAWLRGEFVRRARAARRDYTVDWVHLRLNDQAQGTVMCKDPFVTHDERVDQLLAAL